MAKKFPELEGLNKKFNEMVDATSAEKEEEAVKEIKPEKKPAEKKTSSAKSGSSPKKDNVQKKESEPEKEEKSAENIVEVPEINNVRDVDNSVHVTRAMGRQPSTNNTTPKTFSINKEVLDKLEFIAAMEKLFKGKFFNVSGYVNSLLEENIDKTMEELGLTKQYEERAQMRK